MNRVLKLDKNKKGKDFVVGDIHGRYDQLMLALDKVSFDFSKDRLISVGDLVDRGKQNMQCLGLVWENWFYCVVGNHEVMMATALSEKTNYAFKHKEMMFWIMNGGDWYYNLDEAELKVLMDIYAPLILENMPIAIELIAEGGKKVGITHAGLPRSWGWSETIKHLDNINDLNDTGARNCLWTRTRIQNVEETSHIKGIDLLINGHTPSKTVQWRGNNVFIDLGACNKNKLTVFNIQDLSECYRDSKDKDIIKNRIY